MSNTTHPRTDVYARVTDRIIADLEAGVRPWLKPWKTVDLVHSLQPKANAPEDTSQLAASPHAKTETPEAAGPGVSASPP
jgi:hypothetical protein